MGIYDQKLYVSTDLSVTSGGGGLVTFVVTLPDDTQEVDVEIDGKQYRQLSVTYFAWLRHKVAEARSRYGRRQLPESQWQKLRERFNAVQDQAVSLYGEDAILQALDSYDAQWLAGYQPPTVQRKRSRAADPFADDVPAMAPRPITVEDIYAKSPTEMTSDYYQTMWTMISHHTWCPPLPNIADPFAREQSFTLMRI